MPEAGSSLLLPLLVGRQNAARLLLAGDTLNAQEAERMGLVAYRVASDELKDTAQQLARSLTGKSAQAMAFTKQLMRQGHDHIAEKIQAESRLFAQRLASDETRQQFEGFLKRH